MSFNPFMPTGAFNICCPRDCVSRHNGGTSGAPLKPLRDDSALMWVTRTNTADEKHCLYFYFTIFSTLINFIALYVIIWKYKISLKKIVIFKLRKKVWKKIRSKIFYKKCKNIVLVVFRRFWAKKKTLKKLVYKNGLRGMG